jgi:hypothetical protein
MAFPGAISQRVLYNSAKRVVDELGKGQEVLRTASAAVRAVNAGTKRAVVLVPDVDIIVVDVLFVGEGLTASDTANLVAPAAYDTAPGSTNKLVTAATNTNLADDVVFRAVLTGLNGNRVVAGQPIVLSVLESGGGTIVEVFVQMSYILADEARSY